MQAKARFSPLIVFPGAESTDTMGRNAVGLVCGSFFVDGMWHGFFYDGHAFTQYDVLGAASTHVTSANDAGDFCGYFDYGREDETAFIRVGGVFQTFALPK